MNNSHTEYDVIIVGSGPAGGMCVYELSKRGLSVLLLEKEKLPRYKVCAGGLTKKAVELLSFELGDVCENHTHVVHLTLKHKRGFSKATSFPLVTMVMRDRFDNLLIQKSAEKGAHIQEQTRVTSVEEFPDHVLVKTDKGDFHSKVVVGADGVTSLVARSLGLRKNAKLGVAVEGEMFPNPDSSDLTKYDGSLHLDFNVIPKGYGWIFPKKDHLSVGVFTTLPRIKDIKKYFYLYIADKGLSQDYSCRSLIGHQIPLGGRNEILNTERGLLVGDAAGLADPITGEGIYFALRSGQIAAEVIERSLAGFSYNLDEYTEKIRDEILEDFRYAGYLAKLLYNLSFVSYNLARSLDIVNEGFIKVVSGEYSYREAIKRLPGKMFMV